MIQDGVRVLSPFAEFRLEAPGRRRDRPPERCRTFEDARDLIHSIYVDEHTDLCPLLSAFEPNYAEGPDLEELHDRLAHLLGRGLLTVVRTPLDPECSDMPELLDRLPEHEPFENPIDDGVSVVAEAKVEPALTLEVEFEVEPAMVLEVESVVEPPAPQAAPEAEADPEPT